MFTVKKVNETKKSSHGIVFYLRGWAVIGPDGQIVKDIRGNYEIYGRKYAAVLSADWYEQHANHYA